MIKCAKCGSWFVQETRKELMSEVTCKCKTCQKSFKLFLERRRYAGAEALFFGPYDSQEAMEIIQKVKHDQATKNGEIWVAELSEFESYDIK